MTPGRWIVHSFGGTSLQDVGIMFRHGTAAGVFADLLRLSACLCARP
ncbi:hypothetical protein BH23GEM8_BH23GEM8_07280 [soil metagenome]